MTNVYWSAFTMNNWNMYLAATEDGLCYISSPNRHFNELKDWVARKIPNAQLIENTDKLDPYVREVYEYLQGNRDSFSIPFDLRGTDFQLAVWNASTNIPYGETRTYSEVAEQLNNPKAVRAVGAAIGKNPVLFAIPCHRIVAKNGSLSGFRAGIDVKKALIELEEKNQHP